MEGMDCFSCVPPIKKALEDIDGVNSATVMYMSKSATVLADETVDTDALCAAVSKTGKKAFPKQVDVRLVVELMESSACVESVKDALEDVIGVIEAVVDLEKKLATVTMKGNVDTDDLIEAVKEKGKKAHVVEAK